MSLKLQPNQLLQQQIKGRFLPVSTHSRSEVALTFNAVDQQTQQPVILKYYQGHDHREIQDLIQRGVMLHAQLRSQQVVPIIDFGIHTSFGGVWCVQQKQDYPNLTRFVRTKNQLDSHTTCQILLSLCEALRILHRDDKLHGNLKPNNVFISTAQGAHQTLISDILGAGVNGVHKKTSGRFTFNDPSFFTYEQASGKDVGLQTDIGVLGLLGYFMLTGRMPFEGRTTDKVLTAVIIGSGRLKLNISELTGDTKQLSHLTRIISECLAKQRATRPKGLDSLAQALQIALDSGQPTATSAPPPDVITTTAQSLMGAQTSLNSALTSTLAGSPSITGTHPSFNPLMAGQTIGFDAITDDVLNTLKSERETPAPATSQSAPIDLRSTLPLNTTPSRVTSSTSPPVMIPEPPQEWLEQTASNLRSALPTLEREESHNTSLSSSLIAPLITPSPHESSQAVALSTQSSNATVLGTPKVELPPPPDQSHSPARDEVISISNQDVNAQSGDHALNLKDGWGDMSAWGGLDGGSNIPLSDKSPQEISEIDFEYDDTAKPEPISAAPDEEQPTILSGNIKDLIDDIELDSSGRISAEGAEALEEQTIIISSSSIQGSQGSPRLDLDQVDDLDLDLLFEQAAQDLLQDQSLSPDQATSPELSAPAEEHTINIDLEIHQVAEELDRRAVKYSAGTRDQVEKDWIFDHPTDIQDEPIDIDPQSPLGMILTPDISGDSIPALSEVKGARDIEVGGAESHLAPTYLDPSQERSPSAGRDFIETQLENTHLEHQKLEESFPDIPEWRSLIALKDQPEKLNQALLSISLPLSGQLLPFSHFQLEISGQEREEGFFVAAPAIPVPHIPVVSHHLGQDDLADDVSGLWSDVHDALPAALVTPAVSAPPVQVGKPITQPKSANPLINIIVFFALIALIGGVMMFMNGMNLSDLSMLMGSESATEFNQDARRTRPISKRLSPQPSDQSLIDIEIELTSDSTPAKIEATAPSPSTQALNEASPRSSIQSKRDTRRETQRDQKRDTRRKMKRAKKRTPQSRAPRKETTKKQTKSRKNKRRRRRDSSPLKEVF